jgi:hypothetical protein
MPNFLTPEFFALIRWIQVHSILLVMSSFILMAVWVLWPSNKARIERHGLIPLADDQEGN